MKKKLNQEGEIVIFYKLMGIETVDENTNKIIYREAVRAVIIQNDKILMVQSNIGDYKFPGGGVEINESHEEAIMREVAEETGHLKLFSER